MKPRFKRGNKHESVRKVSMSVCEPLLQNDMQGGKHIVGETSMNPVECPQCHKPFKDVGSFIHHMWVMHTWQSTEALIYWSDNYRVNEDAEKEEI